MSQYITPAQLKEVSQASLQYIADSTLAAVKQLGPAADLIREPIDFDQLNAGEHIKVANNCGIRLVKGTGVMNIGFSISFIPLATHFIEIFIGATDSVGQVKQLVRPAVASYERQPGISVAVRYNIQFAPLFGNKEIDMSNGISDWHVMTLANFLGFVSSGSGDSDEPITDAELEAILTDAGF